MARISRGTGSGSRKRIAATPTDESGSKQPSDSAADTISPAGPITLNGTESPGNPIGPAPLQQISVESHNTTNVPESDNSGVAGPVPAIDGDASSEDRGPAGLLAQDGAPTSNLGPARSRASRVLQGRIEKMSRTQIEGWVWDPRMPSEPVRLELIEGESQLGVAVASHNRPDLVPLGCGDGRHGFRIGLEDGLLSKGQHVLTLRCADTGAVMPGSPIVFEYRGAAATTHSTRLPPAASESQATFRAYIDQISDTGIVGWVMVPDRPLHRCIVVLKERGRVLARVIASQFRLDLLSAGIGDGCYSFVLEPPRSLSDGEEHILEILEEETGTSITKEPIRWCSDAASGQTAPTSPSHTETADHQLASAEADWRSRRFSVPYSTWSNASHEAGFIRSGHMGTRILFDISDLVYYIGHHSNLTGIQRVQSSIVLSVIRGRIFESSSTIFLSFNAATRNWVAIPAGFLMSLLQDLFLPRSQRLVTFSAEAAQYGVLPGAQPFDGSGTLDDGNPSVLCLLGAAWVHQDYLHRVLALKRRFGTRFVMTVHDLIPIYGRETCDQDTARVFEEFMQRALRHVDHILAVSENTAKDIKRYLNAGQFPEPPITVTKNGSSFEEFLPKSTQPNQITLRDLPERFILFVATIEGRKNHRFIFDIWRRMVDEGNDPPHLICVGRLGWKATAFISALVQTNYLDERICLLRDISDSDLRLLYERCLFTVCPTLYEGWGLPVGESLAMGKICVSSDRTSIPEVAGDCGVYIDIDSIDRSLEVIRNLILDETARAQLEAKIRRDYVPITWHSVAERVVAACEQSTTIKWQSPYPYTALPYSTEVSFGQLDRDTDGTGESVRTRIVAARLGHFIHDMLDEQSFRTGEEIRSAGVWAQPEHWGTWLCHSGGSIVVALASEASRFYYVFLRVRVSAWLNEHTVRLLANNEKLWEGKIGPSSKDIVLRVRKRTGTPDAWRLQIEAEVNLTPELRSQITAVDSRVPTIGFERLIVVPESDVITRLDLITKTFL
jgi:glycosyltransferase involved in cell wall biosynthesis